MTLRKTYGGNLYPHADEWVGFRSVAGKNMSDDTAYKSTDSDLRGGLSNFTLGAVILKRNHIDPNSRNSRLLGLASGGAGQGAYQVYSELADKAGRAHVDMTDESSTVSASGDPLDPQDTAHDSAHHQNISGQIQVIAFTLDEGGYGGGNSLNINGRHHEVPSWALASSTGDFWIGREPANSPAMFEPFEDVFIGMFLHLDALTEEELFLLNREIMAAKDIPITPTLPGSVALDHVWSVKHAVEEASGVLQMPSTWSSRGADVPTAKDLVADDGAASADVADFEILRFAADFGPR